MPYANSATSWHVTVGRSAATAIVEISEITNAIQIFMSDSL